MVWWCGGVVVWWCGGVVVCGVWCVVCVGGVGGADRRLDENVFPYPSVTQRKREAEHQGV